ncbi:MAG: hypothetical protein AAGB31_04145 [Bdellovibrio sp.]
MNVKYLLGLIITFSAVLVHARDIRNDAVLNSKMVTAVINGLAAEQGLQCKIAIEESGDESIAYYVEDNRSKFSAGFLCDDGRSAIITGVIGDGGQTAVESFQLTHGN